MSPRYEPAADEWEARFFRRLIELRPELSLVEAARLAKDTYAVESSRLFPEAAAEEVSQSLDFDDD